MLELDLATVRLLDEDVTVRREAASAVDASELVGRYALRQALLTDEDAEVRAISARRLGDARDARFASALIEALGDAMPMVRDRAWRALARLGAEALVPHAERAVRREPVWWVRRAMVRAAASVAGAGAVGVLLAALEDPFWRVRHAAVQALSWLGAGNEGLRQQVRRAAEAREQGPLRSAVAWLEGEWRAVASGDVGLRPFDAEDTAMAGLHAESSRGDDVASATTNARQAGAAPSDARSSPASTASDKANEQQAGALPSDATRSSMSATRPLSGALSFGEQPSIASEPAHSLPPPWMEAGIASEDPAVTTARLEARPAGSLSARELVEWLGDPHEPLRALARRRLREREDAEALRLAMHWLDEPRVPHAQDEARALLERLNVDEVDLATRVLAAPPRPGALAWAARVAVKQGHETLLTSARALAKHPEADIRRAVISALVFDPDSRGLVLKALDDEDASVRAEVIGAWERRPRSTSAVEDFATALVAFAPRATSPRERRAAATAAAYMEASEPLLRASQDEDPSVRAVALQALASLDWLTETEREHAESHEDPWLRAAVLDVDSAARVCLEDSDPSVRRMALQLALSHGRALASDDPTYQSTLALGCALSPDPWIRARAAEQLRPENSDAELRALLRLSRDTELMVRNAAASPLEDCDTLDARLEALLGLPATTRLDVPPGSSVHNKLSTPVASPLEPGDTRQEPPPRQPAPERDTDLRIAAWTWRMRRADDTAFTLLRDSLRAHTEPARVVTHLQALTLTFPDALFAAEPELARLRPTSAPRPRTAPSPRPPPPPRASSRPLGRTGLNVSPLVLSGAHLTSREPFFEAHEAGIDTFFWEPRYAALTQFLRSGRGPRERSVIVAGTYHSGPAALRRDVESALRRLRTSWLDVFLLFWVRAPERLSDEDYSALERLRTEGKLRAFGFSTHLRDLARDALTRHPWPVVMTRHSAAHPGAEAAFFPEAQRQGTGVLTFTTTCYGRLLRPVPGAPQDLPLPSAVDCYRYSLSQPGVSASLTAPRNRRELLHNLDVLSRPRMEPEALSVMRAHGERVRAQGRQLDALVRRAPGGTREALLALLEEDGPLELGDLPST
ncbi:aldo/keto reductase [Myxococcus qinghaiensis]|uniref:aldo/keto reductase n=1 Tax=Myxococcus qinghaiensis TaxID=2906758 RepID=UPI0020A73F8A|nr:aldo/keto reductase [Myxococcus qinghaiensis]MCP3165065.1 HEAT repeat domain-containing protein [Myxococcus qinghaiensis]